MKLTDVIYFFTSSMSSVASVVHSLSQVAYGEDENNETVRKTPVDFDVLMGHTPTVNTSPSIKPTPEKKTGELDLLTGESLEKKPEKQSELIDYFVQPPERDLHLQEEKSEQSVAIDISSLGSLPGQRSGEASVIKDTKTLPQPPSTIVSSRAIKCDGEGKITEIYRETITIPKPPSTFAWLVDMTLRTLAGFFPPPPPPSTRRGYERIPDAAEKPLSSQPAWKPLSSSSSAV